MEKYRFESFEDEIYVGHRKLLSASPSRSKRDFSIDTVRFVKYVGGRSTDATFRTAHVCKCYRRFPSSGYVFIQFELDTFSFNCFYVYTRRCTRTFANFSSTPNLPLTPYILFSASFFISLFILIQKKICSGSALLTKKVTK